MRFFRHYNAALGKEVFTKREYLSEMKKMNLCPADSPDAVPKKYPKRVYKSSDWAHDMVRVIENSTDKDGKVHLPSEARNQLNTNLKAVPKDIKDKLKGGFYDGK